MKTVYLDLVSTNKKFILLRSGPPYMITYRVSGHPSQCYRHRHAIGWIVVKSFKTLQFLAHPEGQNKKHEACLLLGGNRERSLRLKLHILKNGGSAVGPRGRTTTKKHQGRAYYLLRRVSLDHGRVQLQMTVDHSVSSHVSISCFDSISWVDTFEPNTFRELDSCVTTYCGTGVK